MTVLVERITSQLPFQDLDVRRWSHMANADDGEALQTPGLSDKSIQIYGTFGPGGKLLIEGANEFDSPTYAPLSDPQGNTLEFSAAGIKQILENPLLIRPRVTDGDGTTDLTVVIICRG